MNALHLTEFKTCPLYCREDVFDRMSASGFDRETAAEAAESIGFGRTAHKPVILEHLGVPEDISAMAAYAPAALSCRRADIAYLIVKSYHAFFRAVHEYR